MALTSRQARFVEEYLLDLNATAAARRSGYSAKTAEQQGPRLLGNVEVALAIREAQAARSARVQLSADGVLQELGRIIVADPRELIGHRLGCCRHCWGTDYRYQFTPDEWRRAEDAAQRTRDVAIEGGKADPGPADPLGGIGFNATRTANPSCPECFGEGVTRVVVGDTANLSPAALALYAGVKVTKDGLEVKMHPKLDALDKAGRHLGLWDKVEVDVGGTLAELLRAVDGKTRGLPSKPAGA